MILSQCEMCHVTLYRFKQEAVDSRPLHPNRESWGWYITVLYRLLCWTVLVSQSRHVQVDLNVLAGSWFKSALMILRLLRLSLLTGSYSCVNADTSYVPSHFDGPHRECTTPCLNFQSTPCAGSAAMGTLEWSTKDLLMITPREESPNPLLRNSHNLLTEG